jgi:hypothetical protein
MDAQMLKGVIEGMVCEMVRQILGKMNLLNVVGGGPEFFLAGLYEFWFLLFLQVCVES